MARKKRLAARGSRLGLAGSQNSLPQSTAIINKKPDMTALTNTGFHIKPVRHLTIIDDTTATVCIHCLDQIKSTSSLGIPFTRSRECIIVPRQVLDGLLTALHIQLSHPSSHQLKMVTKRYLFALDMDKAIERVVRSCTSCAALSQTPQARTEQSSCEPPDAVGISFAADVLKRSRQLILVLRESVTSYTSTIIIEDERHHTFTCAFSYVH